MWVRILSFIKNYSRKLRVAKIQMLRCLSGHTFRERIRKKNITKGLKVPNIEEKIKENHLKWIKHFQRWNISKSVRQLQSRNSRDGSRKTNDDLEAVRKI